jgi:membrane protein required for colicin V production
MFDISILVIVLLSGLLGVWRGLMSEVMAIVTWVVAVIATLLFGHSMANAFTVVDLAGAREFLGHVSVFILVMITGTIVQWMLAKGIKKSGLSSTDRVLGFGFGVMRGGIIVSLLALALGFTGIPQSDDWKQAHLTPTAESGAMWMRKAMPDAAAQLVQLQDSAIVDSVIATDDADTAAGSVQGE